MNIPDVVCDDLRSITDCERRTLELLTYCYSRGYTLDGLEVSMKHPVKIIRNMRTPISNTTIRLNMDAQEFFIRKTGLAPGCNTGGLAPGS